MAGITYEQVAEAAHAISSAGSTPSIRKVRDWLGTGSPNSVQPLLARWKTEQEERARSIVIPVELMQSIQLAFSRASRDACVAADQQLAALQDDNAQLAQRGTQREEENSQLHQELSDLRKENDAVKGKSQQQTTEISNLTNRLHVLQVELSDARNDLKEEKTKAEDRQTSLARHVREIEQLRLALNEEREERIAAQRAAAVLSTRMEGSVEQISNFERRVVSLEDLLAQSADDLRLAQKRNQDTSTELTVAMRAHYESTKDVQRMAKEMQIAREAATRAEREASELRGRLSFYETRPANDSQ